jgi:hypothetical protein
MHTTSKVCASCHNLTDPIGFGLEKFDAIGMRREQQKLLFYPAAKGDGERRGKPKEVLLDLDTSARVAGVANSEFTSGANWVRFWPGHRSVRSASSKQVFRYMAGRRRRRPTGRPKSCAGNVPESRILISSRW